MRPRRQGPTLLCGPSTSPLAAMFDDLEPLIVILGVCLYVYLAWLGRAAQPRSAEAVGKGALLFWGITGSCVLLACLYGAIRGISPYETLTANFTSSGRVGRSVAGAHLFATTASLLSVHSVIAFLMSWNRNGRTGR